MRSSASWVLEAIRRSQLRTIACSTAIRCSGSTIAPSAARSFLTRASVWKVWNQGRPHSSRRREATQPESQ